MDEQKETATSSEADVNDAVGAAADRIERALHSDDAGRVAGPGAKPEDRPTGTPSERKTKDGPPAADTAAP